MLYALWNPIPWFLFLIGILLCVVSVRAFHRKYPLYPFGQSAAAIQAKEIMAPIDTGNFGGLPRCRVLENAAASVVQELLAFGANTVGVVNTNDELVGIIGTKQIVHSKNQFTLAVHPPVVEVLGEVKTTW